MSTRRALLTAFLTALLAGLSMAAVLADSLERVRLAVPDAPGVAAMLEADGFDVLEGGVSAQSLELIVNPGDRDRLMAMGYRPESIAFGRPFREIQAEQQAAGIVPVGYPDLAEVISLMSTAAEEHATICQFIDLTQRYGTPATEQGRHLYAVKISDNAAQEEDEPAILLVGNHHAREIVTPILALDAMNRLLAGYGPDETITQIVNGSEIWIAPVWNPDGYEYVFDVNNFWRKNRHVFPGGTGVDINRNYPFGWENPCSGSTNPSNETYKGPSPASESETLTMMALSLDQRFAKILDFHSYGREVLHGYACWSHPLDGFLQSEATTLSHMAGYGGSHRDPSADGEHYEWQVSIGNHGFLIETADDFQPPYASAQSEAALIWPGTQWLLQRALPLSGHVTDVNSGLPVEATVTVSGVSFAHGETNTSFGPFGRYHVFLPTGTYNVSFDADGYFPRTFTSVSIGATAPTVLNVALSPDAVAVGPGGDAGSIEPDALLTTFRSGSPGVRYRIGQATPVAIRIFDTQGALVRTLVDAQQQPGTYTLTWDGRDDRHREAAAGVYFARFETERMSTARSLVLVR